MCSLTGHITRMCSLCRTLISLIRNLHMTCSTLPTALARTCTDRDLTHPRTTGETAKDKDELERLRQELSDSEVRCQRAIKYQDDALRQVSLVQFGSVV